MRFPPLPLLILALASAATARAGEPERYVIDPVHTRVMFAIDHAGFSKALGTVSGSEGSLLFDADDWSRAKLEVNVPMERIDMGDSGWAAAIFAPRFLDVKRYPQARFASTTITRQDASHGVACGDLTLHGVTRPFCMDLVLNKIGRYPLPPFRRTAGFSARAQLKRSDFGMTSWRSLVGDDVELRIEAELTRHDDPTTPQPSPQ
ncbi:MAG: polyisoprenoid-binding protein [Xanthomonadales bacterium]|nr:polyisoprenoid-binding protein [Xanthomonadales bacterium]